MEVVEVLLRHKADVSIAASCDWTAMQFATEGKHFAVMELLAKNGAGLCTNVSFLEAWQ